MKLLDILPFALLGATFVIPDQETMSSISIEEHKSNIEESVEPPLSPSQKWHDLEENVLEAFGCARHKFSDAVDYALDKSSAAGKKFEEAFDHQSWIESADTTSETLDFPLDKTPHGKPSHHPSHHHKPNETVYQLISKSKYTTILAKLVDDYPDLVELLNGTAANYTLFAPTDKAFKKIPKHHPKPSKDDLKKLLSYHVSSDFYPAGRVLVTRTIPTLYKSPALGDEPQRLSTQISLKGLTINFFSRIVAVDIFATNGVIHGIDTILLPPPKVIDILKLLPGEFSTLDLALFKTGIGLKMNDTSLHTGGTIFAPTNSAFRRLGPKINAFLFSRFGEKYLKALLEYHLVPDFTLYSDAFYKGEETETRSVHQIPKGRYHVDLPTALHGKSLSIDVGRFGRFVEIKINGFNRVAITDGLAKDGVIHVLSSVLIPPKEPGSFDEMEGELSVEALKERLEPYIVEDDEWSIEL